MKLSELKIDDDFKNLLPELDAETYTALEKDIVSNGMIDPIVIWNGFIADGHNRYEICKAHKITDVQTRELKKESKSAVMQWIVEHQYARRILLRSEKVKVLMKVEEQVKKEKSEKVLANLKQNKDTEESNLTHREEDKFEEGRTAEIMAKKMGVSKNTWKDQKFIVENGTPDKIRRMDEGGHGNGVSTIAKEIKDGIPDGYRRCKKCGQIKPEEEFRKTWKCVCKECYNAHEKENYSGDMKEMPEVLNPNNPVIHEESVVIQDFKNILDNAETSLATAIEINREYLNEKCINEITGFINDFVKRVLIVKEKINAINEKRSNAGV